MNTRASAKKRNLSSGQIFAHNQIMSKADGSNEDTFGACGDSVEQSTNLQTANKENQSAFVSLENVDDGGADEHGTGSAVATAQGAVSRRLFGPNVLQTTVKDADNGLTKNSSALMDLRRWVQEKRQMVAMQKELEALEMEEQQVHDRRMAHAAVLTNPSSAIQVAHAIQPPVIPMYGRRGTHLTVEQLKGYIDPFSGDNSVKVKEWTTQFGHVMESLRAEPTELLQLGRQMLTGTAALYVLGKVFYTWKDLSDVLIKKFHRVISMREIYEQLQARRLGADERLHHYIIVMTKISEQAGPNQQMEEAELLQWIVGGVSDNSVDLSILLACRTLDELCGRAEEYERRRAERVRLAASHAAWVAKQKSKDTRSVGTTNVVRPKKTMAETKCFNCNQMGHLSSTCTQPKSKKEDCYICKQTGHLARECPTKKVALVNDVFVDVTDWYADVQRNEEDALNEREQVRVEYCTEMGNLKSLKLNCILDTGSPASFVRRSCVPAHLLTNKRLQPSEFSGIGNNKLFGFGYVSAVLSLRHTKTNVRFFILPDEVLPTDVLLGREFLQSCGIKLYFSSSQKLAALKFHNVLNNYCMQMALKSNKIPALQADDLKSNQMLLNCETVMHDIIRKGPMDTVDVLSAMQSVYRISHICDQAFVNACQKYLLSDVQCIPRAAANNIGLVVQNGMKQVEVIDELKNYGNVDVALTVDKNGDRCSIDRALIQATQAECASPRCLVTDGSHSPNIAQERLDDKTSVDGINDVDFDIMNINIIDSKDSGVEIGDMFGKQFAENCRFLIDNVYYGEVRPQVLPEMNELNIRLTTDVPIFVPPRRLSYHDKEVVKGIVAELMQKGTIRPSSSEYAAPIVLVKRKSGDPRLCCDYRALNKSTLRDNFPIPLIDDCVEFLGGKVCFSILDLKNGFHQVKVAANSVKYTSFVTPNGQYEWTHMPFGLKNGPAVFQRFITNIFRDMIEEGELIIYIDDILIATTSVEENLRILEKTFKRLVDYGLEVKLPKCKLIQSQIDYLGYVADCHGVRPNDSHIQSIVNFPQPSNMKTLQSCLGLFSYFRRFVCGFSKIAHPLTNLLKKDTKFVFDENCRSAFEILKGELIKAPILCIYSATRETELHTDASSHGFGAVLLQKQDDGKWHPVSYYSKKSSDAESKLHSFELETLAVIYGIKKFEPYLKGISFRIVTDCSALQLTLSKKNINSRIARWALELENYDYTVIHRKGIQMGHVDALSRNVSNVVAVITAEEVDFNLQITQGRDQVIKALRDRLEVEPSELFALENGLVYKRINESHLALYVPSEMERNVIQLIHEKIGHLGVNKCFNQIRQHYWFPAMKVKIQKYIDVCLRCIMHSEPPRVSRTIHMIPKKPVPLDTLHLDFYGPLPNIKSKKRYILGMVDAFTKFVKLYSANATSTKEVCACLLKYFEYYGRPRRVIVDRASCFTSNEFKLFMENNNIQLIKVATASPQANGQIERVNRVLTPMIGKLSEVKNQSDWSRILGHVEYALNNSISSTTNNSPSILFFGVSQRGPVVDPLTEYIDEHVRGDERNLTKLREKADEAIQSMQRKSEAYHAQKTRPAKQYNVGDYVVIRNVDTSVGNNKKLIPKFKGPYTIHKVLPNDRYVIKDIDNYPITQMPYVGVLEAARIKHWMRE